MPAYTEEGIKVFFFKRARAGSQLTVESLRFLSSNKWLIIFPFLMCSFILGFYALLIAGLIAENERTHFWSGGPDSVMSQDVTPEVNAAQSQTPSPATPSSTAETEGPATQIAGGGPDESNTPDGADDDGSTLTLWEQEIIQGVVLAVFFTLYIPACLIFTFFNVALAACVLRIYEGKPGGLGYGLYFAATRLPSIIGWGVVNSIVGAVLSIIESRRSIITSLFSIFGRLAWGLATFFVVPVMVAQNVGPVRALKTSVSLIKDVWGELIVVNLGIGIFRGIAYFVLGVSGMLTMSLGMDDNPSGDPPPWTLAVLFILLPLLAFVVTLFVSALGTIVRVALYYYATEKKAPGPYDEASLYGALAGKPA